MALTSLQPTFVLRGVDPIKVAQEYHEGKFINTVFVPLKKSISTTTTSEGFSGGLMTFRDKSNIVTIVSTNDADVKKQSCFKPRCFWCLQDLPADISTHVPIPYTMIQLFPKDVYCFYLLEGGPYGGGCCSFECALSYIRKILVHQPGVRYSESYEACLKTLYKLCYPESPPLTPAADFRLLNINGGSMGPCDFKTSHALYQLPSLKFSPVFTLFNLPTLTNST